MPYRSQRRSRIKRPFKRTARRAFKRYAKRRSARRDAPSTLTLKRPSCLPDKIFLKLKYTDEQSFTTTAGTGIAQVFRGNSLFDPDFTGTGHQPYGFDQWTQFYSTYRVSGSSVKVTCASIDATKPFWLAVNPHGFSTNMTAGPQPLLEAPYTKYKVCSPYDGHTMIKSYMSTRKIFGLSKAAVQQDNYAAAVTTNPADNWYWQISIRPLDLSTSITVYATTTIIYYVELSDRNDLAAS